MTTDWHEMLSEGEPEAGLWAGRSAHAHRILVPTALDDASALALGYALSLASRFDAELTLLYVFEGPACARALRLESELWRCFSTVRARRPNARLFLRVGLVGQQVKAVAETIGTDLI